MLLLSCGSIIALVNTPFPALRFQQLENKVATQNGTMAILALSLSDVIVSIQELSGQINELKEFTGMAPPAAPPPWGGEVVWDGVHDSCTGGIGKLSKHGGENTWNCAAYAESPNFQITSAGGALEFTCPCGMTQYMNLGVISESNSDFASTVKANIDSSCDSCSSDCNSVCAFYNKMDWGMSCRQDGFYLSYDGTDNNLKLGDSFTSSNVFRMQFDGNTVTFYQDGTLVHTITESSIAYPLNIMGVVHDNEDCTALDNLRLIP